MPNYNRWIGMGNLTRDPEVKHLPSGTPVANFGLAVNRKYNDRQSGEQKEEVLFVDINFFGPRAEVIEQYFSKGMPIHVEGRLRLEQWEADDGTKRSRHTITGDSFEFVQSQNESNAEFGGNGGGGAQPAAAAAAAGETAEEGDVPF